MSDNNVYGSYIRMSSESFESFKEYIETKIGIQMPPSKRIMLESRLLKRLRYHGIDSYNDYRKILFSTNGSGEEIQKFIEAVTTNKTDFFREPEHFNFLLNTVLPDIVRKKSEGKINLWSVASSSGEEPYTMAMCMEESKVNLSGIDYTILATDINEEVLSIGEKGIYDVKKTGDISEALKKRYCLRSRDPDASTIRMKAVLREKILFRKLNLMDCSYPLTKKYHIIFCRNILIYFNRKDQNHVISQLVNRLTPGGYLFIGHSEIIRTHNFSLSRVAPAVYRKNRSEVA